MNRSICVLVVAAVCVGASGIASAADLSVKPVYKTPPAPVAYNWSGIYIGGYAGGLWGDKHWREIVGPVPGGVITPNYDGFIGGGQVGLNYQIGALVLGIEGEWGWTNARGDTRCIASAAVRCGVELESVAMLTGRLGVAWDRALFYVKGGGVWVREDYPVGVGGPAPFTLDHTRDGWTFGGGVEYAFLGNWSAKAEYNYLGLGTDRLDFRGAIEDITQKAHIFKAGINYRFGWM